MTAVNDAPFRLASGGLVDRSRPVSFRFNGQECMRTHAIDTVSVARPVSW